VKLYRDLTEAEEQTFRKWARDNYEPFTDIRGIWHLVVQDECRKINAETDWVVTPFKESDNDTFQHG
jgi:hypothetical protein